MSTKCLIRFDDNPNKVFYGGQMIVGTVLLTLTKELPVKGTQAFVCVCVFMCAQRLCACVCRHRVPCSYRVRALFVWLRAADLACVDV